MANSIDWYRVSKPQDDGYDTEVMSVILSEQYGWVKQIPASPLTMCNGTVAVVPGGDRCNGTAARRRGGARPSLYMADPWNIPHIEAEIEHFVRQADDHLSAWPTGYTSLQKFLDAYCPKYWPKEDSNFMAAFIHGCSSDHDATNSYDPPRNAVYVTFNDPWGCSQGIYHETAHLRLTAVGVGIDAHDYKLLDNPIDELYDSPVRSDVKRPMCAVIHGLYAWVMFTENDLWLAQRGPAETDRAREELRRNIPKIQKGIDEINRYMRPTAEGESFFAGMLDWANDVVVRGHALLE